MPPTKHVLLSSVSTKLRENFYIPEKLIKKALTNAIRSCLICSLGTPSIPRKFIGEERSVSQYMASNKTMIFDVAHLKINEQTFLFLIGVDLASQYCVGTLVKSLTVTHTQQFMKLVINILGPSASFGTDSGSEFSEELSVLLNQLQITHKRFDPQSKNQSLAEPMIRVYRTIFGRLVNNYQRSIPNNSHLTYEKVDLLCSISLRLLNESKPNFSAFTRKELFFGLFYNHSHPPTHYLGDKKDIPLYTTNDTNIKDNIITQRQIQSIFDTRSRLLHQRAQRMNKTSQKITYFIGQIVLDRAKLKENKTYTVNPDHYYVVTTIKQPRCGICLMTQHQCNICGLKPSTSLGLLNLKTGNKTSRNASSLAPLNLDKILDTEFYLDLKNNSPYFADSLNPYRYRQIQEQTEDRYNLRPRTTLEGQFGFIQEKRLDEPSDTGLPSDDNNIKLSKSDKNRVKLYKGKPCKYVQTKHIPNQSAKPSKSILKLVIVKTP